MFKDDSWDEGYMNFTWALCSEFILHACMPIVSCNLSKTNGWAGCEYLNEYPLGLANIVKGCWYSQGLIAEGHITWSAQ